MTPEQTLIRLGFGFAVSQALKVAAELDIADRLADGPRSVADLAAACGVQARALGRMLKVLCAEGVFREEPADVFSLTEVGEALRRGRGPRAFLTMLNAEPYRAFGDLGHSLATGNPAFDHVFGQPRFDWLAAHPEASAAFQAAMVALGRHVNEAVADNYDFSPFATVADIGGGHGRLLSAVLERHPHLSGILFDLPSGVAEAERGVGGPLPRTRFVAGDFFEAVPEGADVYMLKKVIHDWDDERATAILRRIRRVLPPHGRVLVAETLVPPGNDYALIKLIDLNMLAVTGGVERSAEEFAALFAAAGLQFLGVIRTGAPIDIIEAGLAGT
jgi:ubiquinone/menaquinone biosynthesis C-methylase UbiE